MMLKLIPAADWDNHEDWFPRTHWEFICYVRSNDTIFAKVRYWKDGIIYD